MRLLSAIALAALLSACAPATPWVLTGSWAPRAHDVQTPVQWLYDTQDGCQVDARAYELNTGFQTMCVQPGWRHR